MGHRLTHFCCVTAMVCVLIVQTGCRNRNPLLANRSYGPLTGPTTVSPPDTYTVQIPGRSNTNQGSGLKQATNTLPTTNPINVQNGWQPVGATGATGTPTNSGSTTVTPVPSQNQTSVLQRSNSTIVNQTPVVSVTPPNRQPAASQNPINRVAQQNQGLSFTDSTNFRTTAVDERLDQSRLPVTDASQVRAPTRITPSTTVGQFNAPYYVPGRQNVAANAPQFAAPQRIASNPQIRQPIQNQPQAFQRPGGPTTFVGSFGQPTFAQPTQQPYAGSNAQNRVLAQSTVYADPANDPNFTNGWRDRELSNSRDSFSR